MKEFRSNYEGWPTTRCFPRTLEDAFPHGPKNAEWFFPPERERGKLELAFLSVGFWIWLGLAYWYVGG